jgi:hypothetical protein
MAAPSYVAGVPRRRLVQDIAMASNPYAPPGAAPEPHAGDDAADLFVAMQPTMQARAAGTASILTGVAYLFVALQFVLGAPPRTIVLAIEGGLTLVGVLFVVVARGVLGARPWAPFAGVTLCFLAGAADGVVFLASGAASTLTAGGATLVTLVLLAVALGDLRKMVGARSAMLAMEAKAAAAEPTAS